MDVQDVSFCTTRSMDVQCTDVSLSTTLAVWMCRVCILSTANPVDVHGVSLSTPSSLGMQGVSLSTYSSMDVQFVWLVSLQTLSTTSSVCVQGVSLSTTSNMNTSSVDVQGVSFSTFVHFSMLEHRTVWHLIIPVSEWKKCQWHNQPGTGIRKSRLILRYWTEFLNSGMTAASTLMPMPSYVNL